MGFLSDWHCDCSALALFAEWCRWNPIPISRVIQKGTYLGSVVGRTNANRLRQVWRLSDLQKSKGSASHRLLSLGWESEIGIVSEVLAELAPCKTSMRSTRIRGVSIVAEGAGEDLPWPGCIRMGREELVLGLRPLTGNRVRRAPFGRRLL